MKAIRTKFFGPSNFKGSRIRASDLDSNSSRTLSYDHAKNSEENHASAAADLLAKMGWTGHYVGGYLRNGEMVWVDTSKNSPQLIAESTENGMTVTIEAR